MRIRHFLPAALLVISSTTLAFAAAADVAGAETFVKAEHGELKKLVDAQAPDDQVRARIDQMVDYDELARRTMGKPCPQGVSACKNHWDELSGEQQRELSTHLRKLVEKNYRKNLRKTRKYEVTYTGAREQGENVSRIKTKAARSCSEACTPEEKREPPVLIDYVILGTGGGYKVVDIVTEGSSMTKNYYDQFHRMLTTDGQGYPYLIQKLKDKIAKGETK
jgi:phospholipid transport system substrate-binding protein